MRGERGSTLMETAVAFALLTIVLSAGFVASQGHFAAVRGVYEREVARRAAEAALEAARAGPFEALAPGAHAVELPAEARAALRDGTVEVRVKREAEGLVSISAEVRWRSVAEGKLAVRLETLRAARGGGL